MPKSITADMLIPTYVRRFACIGGDCEDTCCAGWRVDLDKESFRHYQASIDPVLRPLFAKQVKRNPASTGPENFGCLDLGGETCRTCLMLTEARRCLIQERLGEKALSNTCSDYPRRTLRVGELHQMTLSPSCPEAARLMLLEEDAFDLMGMEQTVRTGPIAPVKGAPGLPLEVMDEVRTSVIQVLRTRGLDLSRRLKVVGILCERLTALLQEKQYGGILPLLEGLDLALGNEGLAGIPQAREHPEAQVELAGTLFRSRKAASLTPLQRRVFDLVAAGLGDSGVGEVDPSLLAERHRIGRARLAQALEAVPWFFEHYLLNEALSEYFPWKGASPKEHFASLLMRYTILRVMLAGRAAAQDQILAPRELAETVQVFSRRYIYSENFQNEWSRVMGPTHAGLGNLYDLL